MKLQLPRRCVYCRRWNLNYRRDHHISYHRPFTYCHNSTACTRRTLNR